MILRLRHIDLHIENTLEHDQGLKEATNFILATVQSRFGSQIPVDLNWQHLNYLFNHVVVQIPLFQ
jgi:hypothetical protein